MEYLCKRFMWLEWSLVLWNPWNVRGITPSDTPCLFDKLLTLGDNPKPWCILQRSQLAGWTLTMSFVFFSFRKCQAFAPKVEKMAFHHFQGFKKNIRCAHENRCAQWCSHYWMSDAHNGVATIGCHCETGETCCFFGCWFLSSVCGPEIEQGLVDTI